VELTYPNNRKLTYTRDKLNRIQTIAGTSTIAQYDYVGYRILERLYSNNTKLTMLNDAGNSDSGYDGLGRLTQMRHLGTANRLVAGYRYSYNRESMKIYQESLQQSTSSELYQYDSVYRITEFKRGLLTNTKDAIVGTPTQTQAWQLDGVGNWANTNVNGQIQTQTITSMNEYQSFSGVAQTHDLNGNLIDDGTHVLVYDFSNRLIEVRQKSNNTVLGKYTYDAFNRRISKTFTRVKQVPSTGEYKTDANTLGLYHFNEPTGLIEDSSGNNNAVAPNNSKQGVDGLWGTKAIELQGTAIYPVASNSMNNIQDKLTLESWIYLKAPNYKGGIIERQASFVLEILPNQYACLTVFTNSGKKTLKASVTSNIPLPLSQWVHVAGVYDGSRIYLYINGIKQDNQAMLTGNIKLTSTRIAFGGMGFMGRLDEARISNTARTTFSFNNGNGISSNNGNGNSSTYIQELVHRTFYYSGWRLIEEHERIGTQETPTSPITFGQEHVTRQFVDGISIDEHLTQDVYDPSGTTIIRTLYYHENARGDIVAMTDANGNTLVSLEYSAYGEAWLFDTTANLIPLCNAAGDATQTSGNVITADMLVYTFQGRQLDHETGFLYFRNRYYHPKQGRFLQRDPMGYVDGLGLHESFGGLEGQKRLCSVLTRCIIV
jgi:RHS repeat-associated protein